LIRIIRDCHLAGEFFRWLVDPNGFWPNAFWPNAFWGDSAFWFDQARILASRTHHANLGAMFELTGKTALVTGGTRGLGRVIARMLARNGAKVAINYRRDEKSALEALTELREFSPNAIAIKAELGEDAQVRAMVREAADRMGRLDIFVANAAATAFKPLLQMKPHNLERTFNLTIGGFVAAVQEAARVMGEGGRIVMISGLDSIRHFPGHGVLGAAKAAAESMVRDFAFELGLRGITVNGVNVGLIPTDSSRMYFGDQYETAVRHTCERSALGRVATLEEIAAIVCMVCAPEASYLTGQTIVVDGGISLAFPYGP
jgi:enoyl-[acyl-carrier protein] reductase III